MPATEPPQSPTSTKLVAELTLDEKAALMAGADLWNTRRGAAPRNRRAARDRRPQRRARLPVDRRRDERLLPVRRGARRDLESVARRTRRRRARRRGAREGRARAARAHREHPAHADRRSRLRVLRGRSRALVAHRRRVRAWLAGARRRRLRQTLRLQRRRVGAPQGQRRARRFARCARSTCRPSKPASARPARGR